MCDNNIIMCACAHTCNSMDVYFQENKAGSRKNPWNEVENKYGDCSIRKGIIMTLENKLNITDSTELVRMEEKISKKKAVELFENEYLNQYEVGTFQMLAAIHKYLFDEIYDFAGKIRTVNIAKGNFQF